MLPKNSAFHFQPVRISRVTIRLADVALIFVSAGMAWLVLGS